MGTAAFRSSKQVVAGAQRPTHAHVGAHPIHMATELRGEAGGPLVGRVARHTPRGPRERAHRYNHYNGTPACMSDETT